MMNFRLPNKAVASSLMATALIVSQEHQAVSHVDSLIDVSETNTIDSQEHIFAQPQLADEENEGGVLVVTVPLEAEWDAESQHRFEELAEREAFEDNLSVQENLELENLQLLRSRTQPSRSYDEIVADYELHKVINETIASLEHFLNYASRTFPSEVKTTHA